MENCSKLQTKVGEKEYLFFKASDNVLVPFKISGEGKPLLLIHGLGGDAENWNKVVAKLEKKYTCLSIDLRGHGKSEEIDAISADRCSQDIMELTDYLFAGQKFSMAGHSMGGINIMNYLQKYGSKHLNSIILIDTIPKITNTKDWELGLFYGTYTEADYKRDLELIKTNFLSFYSYFMYRIAFVYDPKRPPMDFETFSKFSKTVNSKSGGAAGKIVDYAAKAISTPGANLKKVVSKYWAESENYDARKVLTKISVPTQIIYATPGSLLTPNLAKWMGSQIKKASVILTSIPESNHLLIPLKSSAVADEMEKFLKNK